MSHEHRLQVNLTTNGSLLAGNQAVLLDQPALRQVNISLHSFEQPSRKSGLDAYLAGIFDFIAEAVATSPLLFNLRMWNLKEEQNTGSLILKHLENHFGLSGPISGDISTLRGIVLAPQVFLSREPRFTWPHGPAPDLGSRGYCRGLRDHVAILVDGTVVPCCLDAEADIPLGNIFQANLPEILAGPRAVTIREGFARQRVMDPVCRRCTYRQRFQRHIPASPARNVA